VPFSCAATGPTKSTKLILLDSEYLQVEEEAERTNKEKYSKHSRVAKNRFIM
jgi:hypothetical protein